MFDLCPPYPINSFDNRHTKIENRGIRFDDIRRRFQVAEAVRLHGSLDYGKHHLKNRVITQVALWLQNLNNLFEGDIGIPERAKRGFADLCHQFRKNGIAGRRVEADRGNLKNF